jgi:hypothetical protein
MSAIGTRVGMLSVLALLAAGYDKSGNRDRDGADYYEREFKRVDCDYDLTMDG